jgi:hypothetical protein
MFFKLFGFGSEHVNVLCVLTSETNANIAKLSGFHFMEV